MTSPVPSQVLIELGRLNSHARAWGSGKRAIYTYKEVAAHALLDAGALVVRNVVFRGKCGRCDGTGIYRDWDGYVRGTCYHCTGGVVRLRFAETTLPDGQVWHHPIGHAGNSGDALLERVHNPRKEDWGWLDRLDWPQTVGWSPRSKGEQMVGDMLARSLNIVEDWVRDHAKTDDWRARMALRRMSAYSIRLGCAPADVCWVCQAPATHRLGSMKWPFEFTSPACSEHTSARPEQPHPMLLGAEVLRWAEHRSEVPPREAYENQW